MHGEEASTCILCAGQGTPVNDTTEELVAAEAPELLDELARLEASSCFARAATSTAYAQPAIFCATIANARRHLGSGGAKFAAGHSLGEYSALVIAGALDARTGLRLVALRGDLMQKAARCHAPNGMLAIRAGVDDVAEVLRAMPTVTIANDNGPRQVVLAGELGTLEEAAEQLRARGMRSTRLAVSGAFHHPLMKPAADQMAHALMKVGFGAPRFTVMSGFTARPFENIPEELIASITARVRWREIMHRLLDAGVTRFVDLGPGRVLAGLATKNARDYGRIEVV
jgi:[acyl-carrier-protein] S-malonyltransferase